MRSTVPVPSVRAIARPRLDIRLTRAAERPLTVVVAGAGWGKSTAVAQWLVSHRRAAAWVTCTIADNDPETFWNHVLQAVRDSAILPEGHTLQTLSVATGLQDTVADSLLRGLLSLPEPLLLVVDDFHLVADPGVLDEIHQLSVAAGHLHLMLITRHNPPIPLHRLRASDQLAEVTARDLMFDAEETRQLARAEDLVLSDSDVRLILERTEGWPAGVRLAMLHRSRDRRPDRFAGADRSVEEYLMAEVLDCQDATTRDFLLRTSVAERVCADLAEAITNRRGAQRILEMMERSNQFVTSYADGDWFRYHPLLHEILLRTLKRDHPTAFAVSHARAARWYAFNENPVVGLRHARLAQDWDLFGDIFATAAGPSLVGLGRPALRRELASMAYADVPDTAEMQLCIAGLALIEGQLDAMDQHAAAARALSSQIAPMARVLLEVISGASARYRGHLAEANACASRALALLDRCDPHPASASYRAIAVNIRGIARTWTGPYDRAIIDLRNVQMLAPNEEIDITKLSAMAHLAVTEMFSGDLDGAQRSAHHAIAHAKSKGWRRSFLVRPADTAMALRHVLRAEHGPAEASLRAAVAACEGGSEPGPALLVDVARGLESVSLGKSDAARAAGDAISAALTSWTPPEALRSLSERALTDIHLLTGACAAQTADAALQARLALGAGDHRAAAHAANQVNRHTDDLTDTLDRIDAALILALCAEHDGHRHLAVQHMQHALAMAAPQRLLRPFLIAPAPTRTLLRACADRRIGGDSFLPAALAAGEPTPRIQAHHQLIEPLTARELAVLSELQTMKSNSEIAADLFITLNTVKAHLKSMYRKLDVTNRRAAVRRGRDLGLLPLLGSDAPYPVERAQ